MGTRCGCPVGPSWEGGGLSGRQAWATSAAFVSWEPEPNTRNVLQDPPLWSEAAGGGPEPWSPARPCAERAPPAAPSSGGGRALGRLRPLAPPPAQWGRGRTPAAAPPPAPREPRVAGPAPQLPSRSRGPASAFRHRDRGEGGRSRNWEGGGDVCRWQEPEWGSGLWGQLEAPGDVGFSLAGRWALPSRLALGGVVPSSCPHMAWRGPGPSQERTPACPTRGPSASAGGPTRGLSACPLHSSPMVHLPHPTPHIPSPPAAPCPASAAPPRKVASAPQHPRPHAPYNPRVLPCCRSF
jgi:hypothetical protein